MSSAPLDLLLSWKKCWILFNILLFGSIFHLLGIFKENYAVCNKEYTPDVKNSQTSLF